MHDSPGGPTPERDAPLYQSRRPGRGGPGSPNPLLWLLLVLVLVTAGAVWWWLRYTPDAPLDVPAPEATAPDAAPEPATETTLDVPELDESDPVVRQLLATLSEHPGWAAWLVPDQLVRRFVTSVVNVAAGDSPRSDLDFMEPDDPFSVRELGAGLVIDPASYRRYDQVADVFVSLDTESAVRIYRLLVPLFEDAHRELGLTDRTFQDSFATALGNVLAVPVPQDDVQVRPNKAIFEFADPGLEGLSPAEKHVLRLGPDNARRVQDKLRALATALGIEPTAAR